MSKKIGISVSERALIQRINRKLKEDNQKIRKPKTYHPEVGEYYIVDYLENHVVQTNVNLEKLARDVKALAPYEYLNG